MKKVALIFLFLSLSFHPLFTQIEDGYKEFYYESGRISSKGNFKNGKPVGIWKNYYVTGVLKSEGTRKNSVLDGLWIFYDETGDTLSKISYVNGDKNGYYYKYQKNNDSKSNIVVSKEMYFDNKLEGYSYYFFENGLLNKVTFYNEGKIDNDEFVYNRNGSIITVNHYIKGRLTGIDKINRHDDANRKDGKWREYYENYRIKSEYNYKNGVLDGVFKEFDTNGNLITSLLYSNGKIEVGKLENETEVDVKKEFYDNGEVKFSGAYLKGKPIGIHRFFDNTGKVTRSEEYNSSGKLIGKGLVDVEGYRQGEWTNYYENGEIKSSGKYVNNLREGEWKYFYRNGKIEQKGNYKNNKFHNVWLWYDIKGNIIREEGYYLGKNDGIFIEYNDIGQIISKGEYIEGEKDGEWIISIGDITETGAYTIGLKDGKWKSVYSNGNTRFEGSYIQGTADGLHIYYYDDGVVEEEQIYDAGIKVKVWKKYDKSGNLKITVAYKNDQEIRINGIKIEEINIDSNKL